MAEEGGSSRPSGTRPGRLPRRPYEALCFEPQRIEKGTDRFNLREDRCPPVIATWRNNLTALSQHHNLYFAACSTQIHVFEPTPPGQTIRSDPSIIITPKMKNPAAHGYISTRVPHAINHILVDDLGRDEILLLATDSGNVTGYRTQHILKAIQDAKVERQKAEEAGRKPGSRNAEVDTFFSEFVALSAWGLAIHKYARLIAVAANTTEVTVFAFALVDESTGSNDDEENSLDIGDDLNLQSQDWMTIQTPQDFSELALLMPDRHRSRNLRLILRGHFANIPNISFLNSDLDLEGNWLVSTDIDNRLLVWNIWKQVNPVNHFDFTEPGIDHRGWNVLALDARTFRQARTRAEACGGLPVEMEDRSRGDLDTSHLIRSIPDVSEAYTYFPPEKSDSGDVSEGSFDLGEPVSVTTDEGVTEYVDSAQKDNDSDFSSDKGMDNDSSQDSLEGEPGDTITASTEGPHGNQGYPMEELTSAPGHYSPTDTGANGMELEDESNQPDPSGSTSQPEAGGDEPTGNELVPAALDQHPQWQVEEEGVPMNPTAFLQLVMQDAFGGEISGLEDNDEDDESGEESVQGSGDQLMGGTFADGEGESENDAAWDIDESDDNSEVDDENDGGDDDDDDSMGDEDETNDNQAALYNIFNALVAEHGIQDFSQETATAEAQPQPSTPPQSFLEFPILHFSDTDIRLLTNPFAVRPSLVCRELFKQPFSVPILSIHACDRINMVQSVPELGIVIAATQKGRVAVITLTHVKSEGLPYFRVDWIAPFESQERLGERPLCPLLGIAVGPVPSQLHRYPSDNTLNLHVETKLKNEFHSISMDTDEYVPEVMESDEHTKSKDKGKKSAPPKQNHNRNFYRLDYPVNSHHEPWHQNLEYSRRYRLMLYYSDHTIMSYQFYYDWPRRMFPGIPDAYTPQDLFLSL